MGEIDTSQYPYNLLKDVFEPEPIPASAQKNPDLPIAVDYVISQIHSRRIYNALNSKYKFAEMAERIFTAYTPEQTEEMIQEGLREIRKPSRLRYILYGFAMCEQMRVEEARVKAYNQGYKDGYEKNILDNRSATPQNIPLDKMNLSKRAVNCLINAHRYNYWTKGQVTCSDDIYNADPTELYTIRNLGAKTLVEIINKLDDLGYDTTKFRQTLYV